MTKECLSANPEAKRFNLKGDNDGLFSCLVPFCEHGRYHSKCGCRKHSWYYTKHSWYYLFEEKPEMAFTIT